MCREAHSAAAMYEVAHEAVEAGVDAVHLYQLDGSHGMIPTEAEQETYFRDLLSELDCPIVLSVHEVAGYMASVSLLARLVRDYPKIVAIQLMLVPNRYLIEVFDSVPKSVRLMTAMDNMAQGFALGAGGFCNGDSNVIPQTCRLLMDQWLAGEMTSFSGTAQSIQRFQNVVRRWEPSVARWIKLCLKVLDLPGGKGTMRKPYLMPGPEDERILAAALTKLNINELNVALQRVVT
jgi:dihydrodipicolinate synthase/N-acetylneuraminate lyase